MYISFRRREVSHSFAPHVTRTDTNLIEKDKNYDQKIQNLLNLSIDGVRNSKYTLLLFAAKRTASSFSSLKERKQCYLMGGQREKVKMP